jgi:4-amino-4-deoxy-L-arabinose transferase-like glycosyltransferase
MPKPEKTFRLWLLALLLLNLLARLPLCWDRATVRNDGAEYLAIARSLRATGRYATDLKYQFYTPDPVRHDAWGDRPPLYPAFAALCQATLPGVDPVAAARLGNALAACLALALAALYLRRLYGGPTALLAVGYVFLLPNTLAWTTQPMTEALSLALGFGALLAWPASDADAPPDPRRALAAGLLAGLTYLARPTGGLLLLVFALDLVFRWRASGRRLLPAAGALFMGFAACAAPYHLLLWARYGSPFYSSLGYTFAVRTYYEVTYHGFERPAVTTLEFLRRHGVEIPGLVLRQAGDHAQAILLPLLGLLPFAFWLRRSDGSGARRPAALLVGLTIVVHTLVWSTWGSSRYFIFSLPLMAAALLAASERAPSGPARWRLPLLAASGLGLGLFLAQFYALQARPDHGQPSGPVVRQAAREVRDARLIASDRPATLNLLLDTPAVMLPRTTDRAQLGRFVAAYRPDALVLFVEEPLAVEARAMADSWRRGGLPAGWRLVHDDRRVLIARPFALGKGRPAAISTRKPLRESAGEKARAAAFPNGKPGSAGAAGQSLACHVL